jgi:hypothetical protein
VWTMFLIVIVFVYRCISGCHHQDERVDSKKLDPQYSREGSLNIDALFSIVYKCPDIVSPSAPQ